MWIINVVNFIDLHKKFITDFKSSNTCPLLDDLNHFFARFDKDTSQHHTKLTLQDAPPDTLGLNPHEVRRALSHINPNKAAKPDSVPWQVLKYCAVSWLHSSPACLTSAWNKPLSLPTSRLPSSSPFLNRLWSGPWMTIVQWLWPPLL